MLMNGELRDITGFRGEKIVELCLTDYQTLAEPLFRPGFLGDKWPAIDFYVELRSLAAMRLYFFVQTKTTTSQLTSDSRSLNISTKKQDIEQLLQIPGPTYLFGVHEPSRRVFVRSVHAGIPIKAINQIPLNYELTNTNLQILHSEVRSYWSTHNHKPTFSVFS